MASKPKAFLTPEEYLAVERKAETRSEYWQGRVYAMSGATRYHARIVRNVVSALNIGLRSTDCQSYSSDLRLHIPATGLYTYPDVMVTCGEEQFLDDELDTLMNPLLIVEVLSQSTKDYDLGGKFEMYRSIQSLREYLTIAQDRFLVQQWFQTNQWTLREYNDDPLAAIELHSLSSFVLHMSDIYDKINWT